VIDKYLDIILQGLATLSDGDATALTVLFLVLVLSEFGIPLPFVMQGVRFYIGFNIGQGSTSVLLLLPILILGRQFGAACLFWLTRRLSKSVANWYHKRFKPMKYETEKIKDKLQSNNLYTISAIVLGRITPGLLVPTSLASAVIGINYGYFAMGVLISSVIYDAIFISLAAIFGHEFESSGFNIISSLSLASFIILTFIFWIIRWLRKSKVKSSINQLIS